MSRDRSGCFMMMLVVIVALFVLWIVIELTRPSVVVVREATPTPLVPQSTPALTADNASHMYIRDTVQAGNLRERFSRRGPSANVPYIRNTQAGLTVSYSPSRTAAASHVLGVLFWGAEREVGRTDTSGLIADMLHLVIVRDWPKSQLPRESMSPDGLSVPTAELPISARAIQPRNPDPAWTEIGTVDRNRPLLIDTAPETDFKRGRLPQAVAGPCTEHRAAPGIVARIRMEFDSALTTGAWRGTLRRHHDLLTRCRGARPRVVQSTSGPPYANYTSCQIVGVI